MCSSSLFLVNRVESAHEVEGARRHQQHVAHRGELEHLFVRMDGAVDEDGVRRQRHIVQYATTSGKACSDVALKEVSPCNEPDEVSSCQEAYEKEQAALKPL